MPGAPATSVLAAQRNVLHALIMRDIRTRMWGSAWGYLFVIAWPLSHILVLVGMGIVTGRIAPYGDSMALFAATGIVPFMCFSYMARFMTLGVVANRPLLYFPAISVTDILFARAVLEMLNACLVGILVIVIFTALDIDVRPVDIPQAFYAFLSAMLLGLGVGMINGIIASFTVAWMTGFVLVIIVLWATSGILFVPSTFPQEVQNILWYHPVLHAIEWMRTAYYDGYNSPILTKWYPIVFGSVCLFLGLLSERLFRGRVLS